MLILKLVLLDETFMESLIVLLQHICEAYCLAALVCAIAGAVYIALSCKIGPRKQTKFNALPVLACIDVTYFCLFVMCCCLPKHQIPTKIAILRDIKEHISIALALVVFIIATTLVSCSEYIAPSNEPETRLKQKGRIETKRK